MIQGIKSTVPEGSSSWLLESGNSPLPEGLIVVPSLVSNVKPVLPVPVVNLSTEDVWLQPCARLGTFCPVEVNPNACCEVKFQRISAGVEEVTVETEERQVLANGLPAFCDKLNLGGTVEQQEELKALHSRFVDVFALANEDLGFSDKVQHEIHLVDDAPVSQPYRRLPPTQYGEVREHITKLLKKGVIKESNSAYASPIVLVRKTDGSLRLCVDYRRLNSKTNEMRFRCRG